MSQKRTLSSLRSGPGSASGLVSSGSGCRSTIRSPPLQLPLDLGFCRLGVAQLSDGREHNLPMTERDAEFLQVGAVQVREGAKVDVILGKDLAVFAQTETVQPILNQWHARLRFRQFASTENLGFASSTIRGLLER